MRVTEKPEPATVTANSQEDVDRLAEMFWNIISQTTVEPVMSELAREAVQADLMAPGWFESWIEIHDNLSPQFDRLEAVVPKAYDIHVFTNGTLACLAAYADIDISLADGGRERIAWAEMDMFRKSSGRWLFVQGQAYLPVDPESGKSIMHPQFPPRGNMTWTADAAPLASAPRPEAEAEIREWFAARLHAADADSVLELFGNRDDILVYGPEFPGQHRGRDEVHAYHAKVLAGVAGIQGTANDLFVVSDGELGGLIARVSLTMTMQDGTTRDFSERWSDCLRRIDGRWAAVMEMVSFPADPTTMRPVTSN